MTLTIRSADEADLETVASLWNESAAWLREQGEDQWQYPVKRDNIRAAIDARTCWLVENEHGASVATVTLDTFADPTLWLADDDPDDALYVHRLVVRQDQRSRELGSAILDWASVFATRAGKRWLRLDAWTSNTRLHKYYLDRGFTLVRTVHGPGIVSGTLFERPAGQYLGRGPVILPNACSN